MEAEGEILVFVIIIIAVIGAGYLTFQYFASEDDPEINDTITSPVNDSPQDPPPAPEPEPPTPDQFNTSIPHWDHMPLTYRIVNKHLCEGAPIEKFEEALNIITESTNDKITFNESFSDSDITVNCVDKSWILSNISATCKNVSMYPAALPLDGREFLDDNEYLISTTVIYTNETDQIYRICSINKNSHSTVNWTVLEGPQVTISDSVITSAQLMIYKAGTSQLCTDFPSFEVYDLLKTLALSDTEFPPFDEYYGWHEKYSSRFADIMFPYTRCALKKSIQPKYSDCLEAVYSLDSTDAGSACDEVEFE